MEIGFIKLAGHDAYRYGRGLNKSGAEVFWLLTKGPMTVNEIVEQTGRSRRTVYRVLKRMSKIVDVFTGEIISMVDCDTKKWHACDADLNLVAKALRTDGMGIRQRNRHIKERKMHRRGLEYGRNNI